MDGPGEGFVLHRHGLLMAQRGRSDPSSLTRFTPEAEAPRAPWGVTHVATQAGERAYNAKFHAFSAFI